MTVNTVHVLNNGGNGFKESFKLIIRGLFPVVLTFTGVSLLYLRIPGWSLILGFPVTLIGVALLIYAYDEAVSGTNSYPNDKDIIVKDETDCPKCKENEK